jgi:hypothetical protein
MAFSVTRWGPLKWLAYSWLNFVNGFTILKAGRFRMIGKCLSIADPGSDGMLEPPHATPFMACGGGVRAAEMLVVTGPS